METVYGRCVYINALYTLQKLECHNMCQDFLSRLTLHTSFDELLKGMYSRQFFDFLCGVQTDVIRISD